MNYDLLWSKVLEDIRTMVNEIIYSTWFATAKLYKIENNEATIIVPTEIHRNRLQDVYFQELTSALFKETNVEYDISFVLEDELVDNNKKPDEKTSQKQEEKEKIEYHHESNLNKNYTFETYVVGNSNKLAHATAVVVAESPGQIYNPLFIYGASGLGKTHLMHAIGNYIEQNSNKKVLYVTSEQFIDEFVKTSRKDENGTNFNYVEFFKNKYRNVDVLMIDDIQYLGGAEKSQEEFFHTFNNLFNDSKQIIVSSDRSPDDLKQLEDRLRTRFSWGLGVNISPPDYNLRKDIIKKKIIANDFEKDIPDDVIEYIASNIGPDVRHLEGAITRLVAYSTIMGGKDIDLDLALEALKDYNNKGIGEKNDVHRIQKIVSEYFQISVEDIRSKKRSSNISFPRQIAMYLCREMTSESFPKIGIEFGGKDHSTVMHSVEKIEKEIKDNKDIANISEKLKKDIGVGQ
jgi:chromosomal replication initiator protein